MLHGYTIGKMAKKLGISAKSLSKKINGKHEFTITEAKRISASLQIEKPTDIFLIECYVISNIC